MSSEWTLQTVQQLQDACILLVEDGNHGESRPRPSDFDVSGIAFIRAADMDSGEIAFASASRINSAARARIRKGIGKPGDILLSHKGTVGKLAFARINCEQFVCSPQTTFWRVLNTNVLDRHFVYYFMHSSFFMRQLDAVKGETDMADYVSLTAQRRLRIPLCPIATQHAIVSILATLDDKINLNQRMNETLATTAELIFKDWFLEFGPVRAKMQSRPPYLAPDLWALFPDRLDGEGKPEGWSIGRLDDLIVLQRGFDLPSSQRAPGQYPVMAASGHNGLHDQFMVHGPGVTTGRSGVLGRVFFVHGDHWPLNTSLWVKEYPHSSATHAYFLLKSLDLQSYDAGSAVPTLNRNHVHSLPQAVPSRPIVTAFDNVVLPLLRKQHANDLEIESLSRMRDLLLPKLMSGELRVREAEKALEAVL